MRTRRQTLLSSALAAGICVTLSVGADATAASDSGALPPLVGDLGRPGALLLQGNSTFTREQILSGLAAHLDFHLASHRLAPRQEYAAQLKRQITLGYLRSGFPDVTVQATPDTNTHQMLVQISEGPRYRCGNLLLSGFQAIDSALAKEKILEKLSGLQPGAVPQSNPPPPLWAVDQPAPCDEFARVSLTALVQEALTDLDRFEAKADVRVVPDPDRRRAALQVKILDEGFPGILEEIEVMGARINTSQQVLDYLKLRPGLDLSARLMKGVTNQLANSGRFMRAETTLEPLPKRGTFRLVIDLDELRQTPPLDQEFSPVEKGLLKFRDWIMDWENRAEDLVWSFQLHPSWGGLQLEGALAASGLVLALRTNAPGTAPVLAHAWVASTREVGLYSVWRQRKFALPRAGGSVTVSLNVQPSPTLENPEGFTMSFAAGMTSLGEQPFQLLMSLAPAAFVREAHRNMEHAWVSNEVLTVRTTNTAPSEHLDWQVDTRTGRLICFVTGDEHGAVRLSSEKGGFTRLLGEITDATASHANSYRTNYGVSTGLAFIGTDLIESPVTEGLLQRAAQATNSNNQRLQQLLIELGLIKTLLAEARTALKIDDLGGPLEVLNHLAPPAPSADEPETFLVPPSGPAPDESISSLVTWIASGVLSGADTIVPRDSWPWILLRETAFVLAGQGKFTQTEMLGLLNNDDTGPVACLATASLLGRMNPQLARAFARLGSSRLTHSRLHNDYQCLVRTNAVLGQIWADLLRLGRALGEERVNMLTSTLRPSQAAFLRDLARLLREAAPSQPPSEAVWPAFEKHWEPTLRGPLELALGAFLPQVQVLTNSQALHERGLMLIAPVSVLKDFDEAAQCFRKAADQGHAGAQLNLGILCQLGRGVPQDYAEAMRWFRKAAEQKQPHATCAIGDLYRDGLGVEKNLDEAARWYRPEAEQDCAKAQYSLGRICEEQRHLPEALMWCRRAAEGGFTDAQVHLADLLTDGISVAPDYVEACQWLLLAAQAENRLAQIRLRSVREKLSLAQLEQAERRAAAVTQRLAEKTKGPEQNEHGAKQP